MKIRYMTGSMLAHIAMTLAATLVPLNLCRSMPMPEMAAATIEGDIKEIAWHAEQQVKGLPGMSGSAGRDRTVQAHYRVKLVNTTVTYAQDASGHRPYTTGQDVYLRLNHAKDDGFLKPGMRIRIRDVKERGDEGGVHTSFSKIEILHEKSLPN